MLGVVMVQMFIMLVWVLVCVECWPVWSCESGHLRRVWRKRTLLLNTSVLLKPEKGLKTTSTLSLWVWPVCVCVVKSQEPCSASHSQWSPLTFDLSSGGVGASRGLLRSTPSMLVSVMCSLISGCGYACAWAWYVRWLTDGKGQRSAADFIQSCQSTDYNCW